MTPDPFLRLRSPRLHILFLLVLVSLAPLLGCGKPDKINSTYGRRRGAQSGKSVNGTRVLASMFERAGHRVTSWRRLSPKLENDQVIVWVPDDFQPPDTETRQYLEQWLTQESGRTLVYLGRDYEAAVDYWRQVMKDAPAEEAIEIRRRLASAQADYHAARSDMPAEEDCGWFGVKRDAPPRRVTRLSGPWSRGTDASQVDIRLQSKLKLPQSVRDSTRDDAAETIMAEVLLRAGNNELLAMRLQRPYWDESQIIIVANGSFLLNLPLVNHEHRKLAGQLVGQCGPAGRVVFLETGAGGPDVSKDPNLPTGLEAFTVWPVNAIMLHLTFLGILVCFALFPIFGRPRELPSQAPSDFGKHVEALGQLLERTGDRQHATERLGQYYQQVGRESVATETETAQPAEKAADSRQPAAPPHTGKQE